MSTLHLVPTDLRDLYEVHEWRNATGVLETAYPIEWQEIQSVLRSFKLPKSQILAPGGNRSDLAKAFDQPFAERGWIEKQFKTGIKLDDATIESPTHKIDCYKNNVALEIEWNNKDPFYDRDLNNFRLLFDLRAIGVGVIITRADELQAIFNALGKGSSYGNSTTHMSKLLPRIEGGGGGGCPILVFGITAKLYDENA
ncbi:MAG: hypothetical protein KDA48_11420 [Amphiplicatus sp.]|nr:hypothetical protein [Amphiplicatus sp.]